MVSASWTRRKSSNRSACEPRAPRCTSEINKVRKRRSGLSSLTESLPIRAPLTDSHDSDVTGANSCLCAAFSTRIGPLTAQVAIAAGYDNQATRNVDPGSCGGVNHSAKLLIRAAGLHSSIALRTDIALQIRARNTGRHAQGFAEAPQHRARPLSGVADEPALKRLG